MLKFYDFIGVVDDEKGELALSNDDHTVLTLTLSGRLTLFGPDGNVLRVYEADEVERRQREIDAEITQIYDTAYENDFGLAVIRAFSVVGDALEGTADIVAFTPTPTLN